MYVWLRGMHNHEFYDDLWWSVKQFCRWPSITIHPRNFNGVHKSSLKKHARICGGQGSCSRFYKSKMSHWNQSDIIVTTLHVLRNRWLDDGHRYVLWTLIYFLVKKETFFFIFWEVYFVFILISILICLNKDAFKYKYIILLAI